MIRTPDCDVLIVGAGMCGLSAAQDLVAGGRRVVLLDKGRGPGGRMATRRLKGGDGQEVPCDHGAQFFTVRSERFEQQVDAWQHAGLVGKWASRFPHADGGWDQHEEPRFFGTHGMNALAKSMAQGLDLRCSQTVQDIEVDHHMYRVETAEGLTITAASVILTAPLPQSIALLGRAGLAGESIAHLRTVEYHPCLSVVALLNGPSRLPAPGGLRFQGEPISWMADGRQKGMHSDGHSLVIHAAPEFSLTHFRGDRDAAADILLQHAAEWIGSSKIVSRHVHGWLYSFPRSPQEFSSARIHLVQDVPPLYLAGDGLTGGRIEGAYLSGKDVARSLLA